MRSSAWPTAGIAGLAPLLALVAIRLTSAVDFPTAWLVACTASLVLIFLGGLVTLPRPSLGRSLTTLGVGAFLVSMLAPRPPSPGLTLALLLVGVALVGAVWGLGSVTDARLSRRRVRELTEKRASIASVLFFVDWALVVVLRFASGPRAELALAAGLLVAVGFSIAWILRARRTQDSKWKWLVVSAVPAVLAPLVGFDDALVLISLGGLLPLVMVVVARGEEDETGLRGGWWQPIVEHPARLLVVTFILLSFAGTVFLVLPTSSRSATGISVLDAAFTSVSAVCVTGLIVVDTPSAFSGVGELVLLVLIQLGGLGIMSFSTVTFSIPGIRPSLRHESAVAGLLGTDNRGALVGALRGLLLFTFLVEAIGATLLTGFLTYEGHSLADAAWRGVFTSVSAFCNAGFSLWSDSLISHQQDPFVLHVVAALIIVGGLSPATAAALPFLVRRRRVPLEHKLALTATAALLVLGAVTFLALEWNNTLSALSFWDRIHNAWFQSATARTAGFNSVDIAALRPATITVVIALMFIGGSPGGTAGGVKTTTIVVLLLAVGSAIRGRWAASAFGRRLSHRTVFKAASIVTVGVVSLVLGLFALQLTQTMDSGTALFETASALGTVGLSLGGTAHLDVVGKLIIMMSMFAGRVGPLSLFLFLGARSTTSYWELVEEEVVVG
jgi:trk/ktr system potassium uptake protein